MNLVTKICLSIGSIFYLIFLLRRTINSRIDLFDFLYLTVIVIVPLAFSASETISSSITHLLGIKFPFVLLFGIIHGATYLYTIIQAGEVNKLKQRQLKLTQEVSLLRAALKIEDN